MDGAGRSSFQYGASEPRPDIVSGRGQNYSQNGDHMYAVSRLPPPPPAKRTDEALPRLSSSSKPWGFSDPEVKRRKRIAKYKVYTVEGRVKASIRKGVRWIKNKCSEIIHGY